MRFSSTLTFFAIFVASTTSVYGDGLCSCYCNGNPINILDTKKDSSECLALCRTQSCEAGTITSNFQQFVSHVVEFGYEEADQCSGAILKFEVRAFVGECDKIVYGGNSCASVCVNGDNGKAAIEYALRAKKITAPYLLSPSYNEETCTHRYGSSYGYFISDKCTKVADSASFKVAATQVSIHTNSSTCQGVAQKLPLNNCTSNPESSDFIKFGYQQERLAISLASSNTFALAQLVGSVAFASIVGFLGWL